MQDWQKILRSIYVPEIGTLFAVPNSIWKKFAANQSPHGLHPGVIGNNSSCGTHSRLIPGTSKDYRKGSCIFKTKINESVADYPYSYFLIDLWITYSNSDLLQLKRGWNGVDKMNEDQVIALKRQIRFCWGINV